MSVLPLNLRPVSPPGYDAPFMTRPATTTILTPYLQLPHLLSLTWLAYPILSLLFIAFRLQLSLGSAEESISNAKDNLLTSCKAAERAATAAASMPRYMATATNQQIVDAANATMNGAREALVLSLTVMEAIINFVIDIYRSTFLCFLELVIRGALSILIAAVQDISDAVEGTLNSIRSGIQNDISSANSAIQSAIDAVNKVNPFGDISVPQFSIPSLSGLENVTIPNTFQSTLENLNSSLPTFSDLKDKIDELVDTPFEALKKDINDTFAGLSFNTSVLPVPQQNTLTFCGDLDTGVIDDLSRDLVKIARIGVIIIVILALLLIGANCLLEWYKWKCLKQHLEYTRQAWSTDPTIYHPASYTTAPTIELSDHNLMLLSAQSSHPLLTRISNQISRLCRLTPNQHTNLQWFFNYIFHPPALACFLIGFFGLLSVEIQLAAVGPLEAKFHDQATAATSDFTNTIAASINASMYNQSAAYADGVNAHINAIQYSVNNGLFGWVNGTTTTLNDTISTFYSELQSGVNAVFNGTVLQDPINEFLACFIGSKVDAIEDALTFLHDNLHINLSTVNESVLVLSPEDVNEASQPIATAAIGGGDEDSEGLVGKLVNSYISSLKKERIMFGVFMGLWGIVVLMAVCILLWHSYGRRWLRRRRGEIDKNSIRHLGLKEDSPIDPEKEPRGIRSSFWPKRLKPTRSNSSSFGTGPQTRPDPYPSSRQQPPWEQTWNNFFDKSGRPQPATEKVGKPRKFLNLGRRPQPASDPQVSGGPDHPIAKPKLSGWWDRMPSVFPRRRGEGGDNEETGMSNVKPGGRAKPALSINTDSQPRDGLPTIQTTSPSEETAPVSHWSASPGPSTPPRMPWVDAIVPTRRPIPPPMPPLPPKSPRRNPSGFSSSPSVPRDSVPLAHPPGITSGMGKPQNAVSPPAPRPPAPQERYAFPLPPQSRTLAPPPDRRRRDPFAPPNPMKAKRQVRDSMDHHRRPSQAIDPFVTPFDDEARVAEHPSDSVVGHPSSSGRGMVVNPFDSVSL